ncbi:hypothetical protein O9929_17980 [Vibrio lentus]|nr:hypothetical protein [Vibrio lentus]
MLATLLILSSELLAPNGIKLKLSYQFEPGDMQRHGNGPRRLS